MRARQFASGLGAALMATLLALPAQQSAAAICTWNPASGNWNVGANWSCSFVPTGGPDAAIVAGGKTVTVDTAQSILNLTNSGSVNIDAFLLTLGGGGGTTNTGTINVGAGPIPNNAALQVSAGHNIDNTGGTINISADSVLNQFGSTITGGTIAATGTGKVVAFNSGSNFLAGVALNGTLDMATGVGIERVTGGLTLNGTVNMGSGSILAPQGDQTIGGSGNIVFADNNGSNRLNVEAGNLILGSGITVRGNTGYIGHQAFAGGAATLTNNGTIAADVAGGTITLAVNGTVTNNGTLTALNGGTLLLNNSIVGNVGSDITVGAGSTILQNGVTLNGVINNNAGAGSFRPSNNGNNVLNAANFTGNLDLASAIGVERVAGGMTLNGTINIGSGSVLAPQGDQTIGGTGNIVFADNNGSNRLNVEAGNLTLGSNITVHGNTGYIGQQAFAGGAATLTNNGTIAADVAGGTITLAVNGTVTNNGTLTALNGGTLVLNNSIIGNLGSDITVGAGSTILQNGVTLNGVITNAGTGSFRASNNSNNVLNAANFTGNLDLASAIGVERVAGGMTLNGTINIGSGSVLAPQGNQNIGGTGNIVFADNNAGNRLNVEAGNLTLGSNITVHGNTGIIGQQAFAGGAATLTNNGTIAADVAGGTITLAVNGTVTNNGTLTALNGGTLVLNNSIIGNLGSDITVGAGSTILQNGVTLNGVINNSAGTGSFRASNSGSNSFNAASFTGDLDLASAVGVERVTGGLTLNGTVNIGSGSVLAPQGDQTIGGSGNIVFADNNAGNRLNVEAGNLTLGSGITVRGNTGIIGQQAFAGGAATLTNNGTIQADVAGGAVTLAVNGLTTNNGTLAALNGGTLNLNSAVTGNTGSQILAGAGSVVNQNAVTISGDMNLTGPGLFRASNSGSNVLSGVTLSGTLDLASATAVERVSNGLTLNGATINIGSGSVLAPQGDQTIGGTGNIIFADVNGSNRLNVEAGNLTLASGVVVRGGNGVIGQQAFAGGAATLTNQGLISADVNGRSISFGVNGAVINQGTMRAQNGGQLVLNTGGGYDNSAGIILADTGSTVLLNAAAVNGGALNGNGSGKFVASNSGSNVLNGVTLNGVLDMATATGIERITAGGMSLNGTINIGNNSILAPQGDQTLGGTGNIVFADGNVNNRLNVEAGNLVIGSGVTVRGQTGYIGHQAFAGGAATLTNNGTFNADAGGTITVAVNGALTSNGTMRAQNGTLTIQNGLTGTGTLQVDSTGVMNLTNSPNSQGMLVMGAAGSTLNIGTQNLTINTDYTNVAAASGNSFDRRAGVSGAGLIVAGGNAAQAITGSNVTNGNTTNATLTIGNVRVGATTFDYQIANTGSTGPSLRGAIQTSVNGGNLTDARLSGTGITAANYNTGAPGSNTGDLAVTFTVASAGALAPLSGQVLNLRSNFENIADQKLNIVLGSNAAAYSAAVGSTTTPVQVANQRVGGSNTAVLTVSNTALGGAFAEDLRATFGTNTGAATNNGGTINALVAGGNDSSAMRVGVNTGSAGVQTGTVTLNYQTTGTVNGVSNGLGLAGANAPQSVTVSGNVYQVAQPNPGTLPAVVNLGNFRAGAGAQSQTINIHNDSAGVPIGFQEGLAAAIGATTGGATGTGFANAAVGNSGALQVGLSGIAAGSNSGTVQVQLQSNGITTSGSNGLGSLNLGSAQTITVNGAGYVAASGAIQTAALSFGNVQAGTLVSQNLVIRNTADGQSGYVEDLNASFATGVGTGTGGSLITGTGSLNGIVAGANSTGANGTMTVSVNTGAAGVINGGIDVNYFTAGAVNGVANTLGESLVGSESYGVAGTIQATGNVIDQAAPVVNGVANPQAVTVTLGNVRINGAAAQTLTVLNQATGNQQALLNSSIASNGGPVTASGSFSGLAPGATIPPAGGLGTSLQVGIDTSVAGLRSGSATISHVSDITSFGNCGTSCALNLANQTVNVSANVYRLATGSASTVPVDLGPFRVGVSSPVGASLAVTNTAANDGFSEQLGVQTVSSGSTLFTASNTLGSTRVNAGDSAANAIAIGAGSGLVAGTNTGSVTVQYLSDGTVSGTGAPTASNSQQFDVTAKGYTPAVGQLVAPSGGSLSFGTVRVGTAVAAQDVTISNGATSTALNDTLKGTLSVSGAGFSGNGAMVSGLAAGQSNGTGTLQVGFNTATAGVKSGTAQVAFSSQNPEMADLALGSSSTIGLSGTVNALANPLFSHTGGSGGFGCSGNVCTLNFGTLMEGSGMNTNVLKLQNLVSGPADELRVVFDFNLLGSGFGESGFFGPVDLTAGSELDNLALNFDATTVGNFSSSFFFDGASHNDFQNDYALGPIQFLLVANVIAQGGTVPEPGTLALLALALAGMLLQRRRVMLD